MPDDEAKQWHCRKCGSRALIAGDLPDACPWCGSDPGEEDWKRKSWEAMTEAERRIVVEPKTHAMKRPTATEAAAVADFPQTIGGDEDDWAVAITAHLSERGLAAATLWTKDMEGRARRLVRLPSGALIAPKREQWSIIEGGTD